MSRNWVATTRDVVHYRQELRQRGLNGLNQHQVARECLLLLKANSKINCRCLKKSARNEFKPLPFTKLTKARVTLLQPEYQTDLVLLRVHKSMV